MVKKITARGRRGKTQATVAPLPLPAPDHRRVRVGDCIPHMLETMESGSVDLVVTSVPFPSVFAYTDSEADLGNAEAEAPESKIAFGFFFRGLRRVLAPGRAAIIHCMQVPNAKRTGKTGLSDFRGLLIRLGKRAGLSYEFDWHIRKSPQAQAIRTHCHQLQFAGLERDRANSRGALGDYCIKFMAPGENARPVTAAGQVSRDEWIRLAEGSWEDIRETDTLNAAAHRREEDTRHICPLQIGLIDKFVRLLSDPGDLVFDPFAGIGSTLKVAARLGRRVMGSELREDWAEAAERNLLEGEREWAASGGGGGSGERSLFDVANAEAESTEQE